MHHNKSILIGLSWSLAFLPVSQIQAQLLPDNHLGVENSVVNSINSLEDRINGGAIRGTNLFHSFKEFNIDSGKSIYFNNPNNIQNILTRVTGDNQSQILGKLGVLGNANLFLINPKGIIFGKDATLDINGSFVGSTASLINFADGTQFSAVSPGDKPLLTISTPIGLGMGNNPGEIRVMGEGHKFSRNALTFPFQDKNTKALEIKPGNTIALIGGNIILNGASIKNNSGRIELGSVGSGDVDFTFIPQTQNLEFGYDRVTNFQDIQLLKLSSVSSLSTIPNLKNAGSIQLQGKRIFIEDGSIILSQNTGNLLPGSININATESLNIIGSNEVENQSILMSQGLLEGKGSDIKISTKELVIQNGGSISAYTFSPNSGGDIEIVASDSVKVSGSSNLKKNSSTIVSSSFNTGNGGTIDISTNQLNIRDGGVIASSTFAKGNGGNINIDATKSVEVEGIELITLQMSLLSATTFSIGNAGNLTMNTKNLIVKNSGRVDASTVANGSAGNLTINASDKIELTGSNPDIFLPSRITSSADILDESIQKRLGFLSNDTGESGVITINTNQFNITDNALLIVENDGSGNAGKLKVIANSINLDNQGSINATTVSGEGGNIDLQTQNLLLRNNSNITATSGGVGNGGNISIETQVLTALQNSDITANSEGSFGGRVVINAKGIFGTQFREFPTQESDITATSGLGKEFNGVVDINSIRINPSFKLTELSNNLTDSSQKIAGGCSTVLENTFTISGRGGLPENPSQLFIDNNPIVNLVNLVTPSENKTISSKNNHHKEIIEARGWITDAEGNIEFVAEVPQVTKNAGVISQANCSLLSSN